jgi:hypothetical protein
LSLLGAAYTRIGETIEGATASYAAFQLKTRLGLSDTSVDLRWLSLQQEALGPERFAEVVGAAQG